MSPSDTTRQKANPPDSLDFEITDFATAREALDALPPGVGRVSERAPRYWDSRRRPPSPTDRALSGAAIDWMLALPPSQRPHTLCARFPRVANALAAAWADMAARTALLDSLLADGRGGRAGFPGVVRAELERLRKG